jgi:protein SCO1/2
MDPMKLTRTQIQVIAFTAVLLIAGGWFAYQSMRSQPQIPAGPQFGGEFALTDTTGATFTEADLIGSPTLMFFGYTYCPDVCPTTLAESVAWKQALGISDDQLRTIFVTVDPARDTLELLKSYLGGFDPDVIGLVGDDAQTAAAKASFGAASEIGEARADGFYLVNHTASVFLIDRNGRFQSTIAYGEPSDTATAKIKRLMGS